MERTLASRFEQSYKHFRRRGDYTNAASLCQRLMIEDPARAKMWEKRQRECETNAKLWK